MKLTFHRDLLPPLARGLSQRQPKGSWMFSQLRVTPTADREGGHQMRRMMTSFPALFPMTFQQENVGAGQSNS